MSNTTFRFYDPWRALRRFPPTPIPFAAGSVLRAITGRETASDATSTRSWHALPIPYNRNKLTQFGKIPSDSSGKQRRRLLHLLPLPMSVGNGPGVPGHDWQWASDRFGVRLYTIRTDAPVARSQDRTVLPAGHLAPRVTRQ